jgi:hypothetical protein
MLSFTKKEFIAVCVILTFVGIFMATNLSVALRRARDAQRKADIGAIADALEKYHEEFGYFPPSIDGSIVACKGPDFDEKINEVSEKTPVVREEYLALLAPCVWGEDSFTDVSDSEHLPYMQRLPRDPYADRQMTYLYLSNQNRYQLFTALEGGNSENGYDTSITARALSCGAAGELCSFGKSYGDTPLDRSIEVYEEELVKLKIEN